MRRTRLLFLSRSALLILLLCAPINAVLAQDSGGATALEINPFGVIESHESPEQATQLGVGWTRVIFNWAEVQAGGPDSWIPRISEAQIESEIAAGRMVVGLLIGIPDWARDGEELPQGLGLPVDDPNNLWAGFVRRVVSRYAGRIDHWIIWNEPDIAEDEIAHTWDGSVADFAQLQRVAYLAAKGANPAAVIHLAAFTYWADYYAGTEQYMARLLDEIAADPEAAQHDYYFDVATAHLYFQPSQVYDLLNLFIEIMRKRGLAHPIWLVETNAPPKDDPLWPVPDWTLSVTSNEQAAFMPQVLASAMAAGAERVAVYKLKDIEEDTRANPEPFGLLRMDGSRRPAFDAYRIAIKYLSGSFAAERERWNEVGQVRFDQTGQTTTVIFSRLPQPQQAQVVATDETAVLADMWGTKQVITATDGLFTVDLPGARCSQSIGDYCMIGGFTYYLVQSADVERPTSTPQPTDTPRPTSTPAPSATARPTVSTDATPTPQPEVTARPTLTPSITVLAQATDAGAVAALEATRIISPDQKPRAATRGATGLQLIGVGLLLGLALTLGWLIYRRLS